MGTLGIPLDSKKGMIGCRLASDIVPTSYLAPYSLERTASSSLHEVLGDSEKEVSPSVSTKLFWNP